MKKLITINSVEDSISDGKSYVQADKDTIITPAALDMIKEKNIRIERKKNSECAADIKEKTDSDYDVILKIVKKILGESSCIKKENNSGVIHIDNQINLEPIYKNKNVYIKDILNSRETSSMCAGFMLIKETKYDMKMKNEEIDYITEGEGEIVTKDGNYTVKKGDTIYIPKDSEVSYETKENIKIFYVCC